MKITKPTKSVPKRDQVDMIAESLAKISCDHFDQITAAQVKQLLEDSKQDQLHKNLRTYIVGCRLKADRDALLKRGGNVSKWAKGRPFGLGKSSVFHYIKLSEMVRSNALDCDDLKRPLRELVGTAKAKNKGSVPVEKQVKTARKRVVGLFDQLPPKMRTPSVLEHITELVTHFKLERELERKYGRRPGTTGSGAQKGTSATPATRAASTSASSPKGTAASTHPTGKPTSSPTRSRRPKRSGKMWIVLDDNTDKDFYARKPDILELAAAETVPRCTVRAANRRQAKLLYAKHIGDTYVDRYSAIAFHDGRKKHLGDSKLTIKAYEQLPPDQRPIPMMDDIPPGQGPAPLPKPGSK